MNIEGKVAIVTGACGGIGKAVAQRLLEHGARVVVSDVDAVRVDETVRSLETTTASTVIGRAADCSAESEIRALVQLAEDTFGPVDLYVANAGVARGYGLDALESDWTLSLDVNLMAHVRAARVLVPGWIERGHGYFVSTASAAGLLTQIGSATYSATKHAAVAFAEWLSITYGNRGISVSCICPMGVNTAMLNDGTRSEDATERLGAKAVTAAGSVLEPLQVADMALRAIETEQFLVLPHPEVLEYFGRKSADYERWLSGMRRYQAAME